MVLSFIHYYAFYLIAGILTRFLALHFPDNFIVQGLIFAQ